MNALLKIFLLFFSVLALEAQIVLPTPFSSLPLGTNLFRLVKTVKIKILTQTPTGALYSVGQTNLPFAPSSMQNMEEFVQKELRSLKLQPKIGAEKDDCIILVETEAGSFENWETPFKLEKTGTGWKIPEKVLEFQGRYGLGTCIVPGITGYEATVLSQDRTGFFSTITGENTIAGSCDIPSAQSAIKNGFLQLALELTVTTDTNRWWDEQYLSLFQNERYVTLDENGLPLQWSTPPPSFFRPPPLRLLLVQTPGGLELQVTGDGAESAIIEESSDLKTWEEVTYSPTSSIKATSLEGERRILISNPDKKGFYRARMPEISVLQKTKNSVTP